MASVDSPIRGSAASFLTAIAQESLISRTAAAHAGGPCPQDPRKCLVIRMIDRPGGRREPEAQLDRQSQLGAHGRPASQAPCELGCASGLALLRSQGRFDHGALRGPGVDCSDLHDRTDCLTGLEGLEGLADILHRIDMVHQRGNVDRTGLHQPDHGRVGVRARSHPQ